MREDLRDWLRDRIVAALAPLSDGGVVDWVTEHLVIPPPQTQEPGPFSFSGREYLTEIVEDFGDPRVTDSVACFGSQSGKTTALMAGVAWTLICEPTGALWVMPSIDLARSFSETRWQPLVLASPILEAKVPRGAQRHDFKKIQQRIGASVLNFIGSNSPANLASRPARLVILDEVDKFDRGGRSEADAVNLAEQRTKSFANPKRVKTSTPTIGEGLIWQEYLKGDQRRFHVPCPTCAKSIVLGWSRQFTVLPILGCEAWVKWDAEAKRKDGSWDLDRVSRSARAECPHCGGHIIDAQKTAMIRSGEWRATAPAMLGFRSRHLSSLYANSPQTNFGALAVTFLQAKQSLLGLQGFINGALAEPYLSQDISRERLELVAERVSDSETWVPLMTVDCQEGTPAFWYCVRRWLDGNSEVVDAGSCNSWEEVAAKQAEHGVVNEGLFVDSGFGARSEADVYGECGRHAEARSYGGRAVLIGWTPTKGQPGRKRWSHPKSKLMVPWMVRQIDPYDGTSLAGKACLDLLLFSGDVYKDILDSLRKRKGGHEWRVADSVANDEYWRHLDAEVKTAVRSKLSGQVKWQWVPRSKHWPNHLLDCEVLQIVAANYLGLFNVELES